MPATLLQRAIHFAQGALGILLRHPITGTSIIAILPDGRIVLVKRTDNQQWSLPGGMVDWGEDIPTTIERELWEETGLKVEKINRLVGVYSAPQRDPRLHCICVVVEAAVSGEVIPRNDVEVLDIQAFERSQIPLGELAHDHDQQLQDYFAGLTTLA
jgi:ADP-ribose pyrophosphatase YjhB (NUDIX family)